MSCKDFPQCDIVHDNAGLLIPNSPAAPGATTAEADAAANAEAVTKKARLTTTFTVRQALRHHLQHGATRCPASQGRMPILFEVMAERRPNTPRKGDARR